MGATNPTWKKFERWVGSMIGGRRFHANAGAAIDCEGPTLVAQCKLVQRMSLEELTDLATRALEQGRAIAPARGGPKVGIVAVKLGGRRGGKSTPALFVFHEDAFRELHGPSTHVTAEASP